MSLAGILRRNIVLVVCIPSLVAIHYGWYSLQFNELFVSKKDREDLKVAGFVSIVDSTNEKRKD